MRVSFTGVTEKAAVLDPAAIEAVAVTVASAVLLLARLSVSVLSGVGDTVMVPAATAPPSVMLAGSESASVPISLSRMRMCVWLDE